MKTYVFMLYYKLYIVIFVRGLKYVQMGDTKREDKWGFIIFIFIFFILGSCL
jgi:hypothetical protein